MFQLVNESEEESDHEKLELIGEEVYNDDIEQGNQTIQEDEALNFVGSDEE